MTPIRVNSVAVARVARVKLRRAASRRSNSTTLKTSMGREAVERGDSSRPTVASPRRKVMTQASLDRQKRPMPTMMMRPPMASCGAPWISGIPRLPARKTKECPPEESRRFNEPEVRRICRSPVAPTRIASGTCGNQLLACRNRAKRLCAACTSENAVCARALPVLCALFTDVAST